MYDHEDILVNAHKLTRTQSSMNHPQPTINEPDFIEVFQQEHEQGTVPATDGCRVEPDGKCEHGHVSWLVYWGVI